VVCWSDVAGCARGSTLIQEYSDQGSEKQSVDRLLKGMGLSSQAAGLHAQAAAAAHSACTPCRYTTPLEVTARRATLAASCRLFDT
jgi:hypothetical protein